MFSQDFACGHSLASRQRCCCNAEELMSLQCRTEKCSIPDHLHHHRVRQLIYRSLRWVVSGATFTVCSEVETLTVKRVSITLPTARHSFMITSDLNTQLILSMWFSWTVRAPEWRLSVRFNPPYQFSLYHFFLFTSTSWTLMANCSLNMYVFTLKFICFN